MENPFALSGSPYFNDLVRAAQKAHDTGEWEGPAGEELASCLAFMRQFLDAFRGQFERGMQVRERTALGHEVNREVHHAMTRLEEALHETARFLQEGGREHLVAGLEAGREAVESMFRDFARLQEEDAASPHLSRSPHVHELLRLAKGVAGGDFPAEALAEKLGWMLHHFRRVLEEGHDSEAAGLQGGMVAGLEEMAQFFQDGDPAHLECGGGAVREAGEKLVDHWEESSVAPRLVFCPRCSFENQAGSWRCGGCGSPLPGTPTSIASPSLDLVAGEAAQVRLVPANLVTLERAVQEVLNKTGSREDFEMTLAWFAEPVHRGRREFEAWSPPVSSAGEAERDAVALVREIMDDATREAVEGVERMGRYLAHGEVEDLREGLETVRGAADKLVQAYERAQAPAE